MSETVLDREHEFEDMVAPLRRELHAAYRGAGGRYEAWSLDVLTLRDDRIAAITSFIGPDHFPSFGLPRSIA